MSFINIVMLPDFISVISDGQITTNELLTQSHFKKFESNPNGFVVGITGFELITNNIRKKFYYQPNLSFEDAELLLRNELEKYKNKQVVFGLNISFNAMIAVFPLAAPSLPRANSFHVENQTISEQNYEKSAVLSLVPDDINFNPNQIITDNLHKTNNISPVFQIQTLQRNALYKVADQSKTVNKVIFQEIIQAKTTDRRQ
ncbi:MAG: hypothetical protein E7I97_06010 [Lactococcus lactis]|nr:hypothetical protein [Lactococcus lactis]